MTLACFGLSYLLAFFLELIQARRPGRAMRIAAQLAALAGVVAHTIYLAMHSANFALSGISLVAVAWVLAIFTLYGSVHHGPRAWGIYGWPVVLIFVTLALLGVTQQAPALFDPADGMTPERFWGVLHGLMVLSAAVGVSVGCLASIMYLVQADRVRRKVPPIGTTNHLRLERLELMNRRGVNFAFPLLSAGLLIGLILLKHGSLSLVQWLHVKVLGTLGLWLAFLVLLYLRYGVQISGRRLAWLTIATFLLMVLTLWAAHPFVEGAR